MTSQMTAREQARPTTTIMIVEISISFTPVVGVALVDKLVVFDEVVVLLCVTVPAGFILKEIKLS